MEYLIRFSQSHESFRLPEIQALAEFGKFDIKVLHYELEVRIPDIPVGAVAHAVQVALLYSRAAV
jgi:tRNA G10  N-methylase Trm11